MMDDKKIIALFLDRDEDAIRHTADAYGGWLFRLADNILRNEPDAEESVSDTYWKAWQTIPPTIPNRLFAYLAKICRNFALKKLDWRAAAKRSAEVVSLTQEMENCIPDTVREREVEARELGRILDGFIRSQNEENQLIFLRRYWYVDTVSEIAERYGLSEGAVQMRLNRMKTKLAAYLEKEGIRL